MQTIRSTTLLDAPVPRCFLLALSLDLHFGAKNTSAAPPAAGLLRPGQTASFPGRHLGINLSRTVRIDAWRPYTYFREIAVDETFIHFEHNCHFASMDDGTRLRDEIRFSIAGTIGRILEGRLRAHLLRLLKESRARLEQVARSEEWHRYLDDQPPIDLAPITASHPPAANPI